MDTMSPDHDEAEFADVVALLRHTYEVRADDVEVLPHRPFRTVAHATRRPNWRVGLSVAAAALVVAGVVGVVALRDRGESGPGAETTLPSPTNPTASVTPTTTPTVAGDRRDVVWFLPAELPQDFEITDVRAFFRRVVAPDDPDAVCCGDHGTDAIGLPIVVRGQTFIRPASAGAPTGSISASAEFLDGAELLPQTGEGIDEVTVHGVRGYLGRSLIQNPSLTWVEANNTVTIVASVEQTSDELLAIAEASTVGERTVVLDPASLPAGFELADPFAGVDLTIDHYQGLDGSAASPDGTNGITWSAHTATLALDFVVDDETERRVVDGVEYSIRVDSIEPDHTTVTWLADGWELRVAGPVDADGAMAVAQSVREVSSAQAADAGRQVTDELLALPTVASVVLPDGTRVSVHRALDGVRSEAALCVELDVPRCIPSFEPDRSTLIEVFDLGGQLTIVGWDAAISEATADGRPIDAIPASTGHGAFVAVPVDAPFPMPSLSWTNLSGPLAGGRADYSIRP
jgi:hypothetical protein